MHLLRLDPVSDQRTREQYTCPSSVIAFDMINHLIDMILHVLVLPINHHIYALQLVLSCNYVVLVEFSNCGHGRQESPFTNGWKKWNTSCLMLYYYKYS